MFLRLSGFRLVLFTLGWQSHILVLLVMVNYDPWNCLFFFLYLNLYCGQLISHQAYITSSKHSEIEHIHNLVLQVPAFCFFVFLDHLYLNFLVPWCLLSSEVWRRNALSPCFWSFRLVSVSNTWCLPYIIVRHLPYKWFISLLILLKKELVNAFCG